MTGKKIWSAGITESVKNLEMPQDPLMECSPVLDKVMNPVRVPISGDPTEEVPQSIGTGGFGTLALGPAARGIQLQQEYPNTNLSGLKHGKSLFTSANIWNLQSLSM
jgi:hypothetical protein